MSTSYNVAELLRAFASSQPQVSALRFPTPSYTTDRPAWDTWTFRQLDHESDAYARGLTSAGVRPGDRVSILFKPSLAFYAVLFGLFKAGAVPVLLDSGMGLKNLLICLERTAPRVMVAMPMVQAVATFHRRPFRAVELKVTAGPRLFWGGTTLRACRVEGSEPFALVPRDADDDAAILFTSGSTGPAKGVSLRQAQFRAQVASLQEMLAFRPGLSDVQCFAAFAIFDLCMGMTSVIPKMDLSKPASADPRDILAAITTFQPEVAFGSPIVWQNLSRHCLATQTKVPALKTAITVGAPVPAYLHRRFQGILPSGCEIHTPYGATEGLPVSHIATNEILGVDGAPGTWERTAAGHGTCVGRFAPGIEVRIARVTDEPLPVWTEDLRVPDGEVGEVVIGGDQVSLAYHDAPEANRYAKIQDGTRTLHRMGDLGYVDPDGRLWFCGRKAHRLETPTGMVPAVPVEGVFNEHPDVFRTALIGVGPRGREVPVLCVEMEPGKVWSAKVQQELEALAAPTRWAGLVQRWLPHEGFPTDARHNSKIRSEDLKEWATARCPDLAGALVAA